MATRWERVEELYHAALARVEGERAAFLRDACGTDEDLRREVESLLAQPVSADGVLATGAAVAVVPSITDTGSMRIGQRIGVYQLRSKLGAGGMGEVYRARDTKLGRDVAIKILPRVFTSDPDRLARFEREARVLASLNHRTSARSMASTKRTASNSSCSNWSTAKRWPIGSRAGRCLGKTP